MKQFDQNWLYAREKLTGAVHSLVVLKGSLNDRLPAAWVNYLIHLRRENLPNEELWTRLQKVGVEFRKKEHPYLGSAVASMQGRRHATLARLAGEIFDIHRAVEREISEHSGSDW